MQKPLNKGLRRYNFYWRLTRSESRKFSRREFRDYFQQLNDAQFLTNFGKSCDGFIQMSAGMSGRKLNTNSRLFLWYHWVEEAYDVNTFLQQSVRKVLRELCVVQHDWNDCRLSIFIIEARSFYSFFEVVHTT